VSQDGCSLTANSAPPAGCPAELRQDGNRCVVRVNSFKAIDHQGRWECFLVKTLDGGSSFANLTASMVMLREAIPKVEPTSISLSEFEMTSVKCRTTNAVFRPDDQTGTPSILKWNIDGYPVSSGGDHAQVLNETAQDCSSPTSTSPPQKQYEEICKFDSTLRYKGTSGDFNLGCTAVQTDSFGRTITSAEVRIDVNIVTGNNFNVQYEHWMRRAFWREYLHLFIFPLGGTTDFGRRV
jgi:hypothetical protein